MAQDVDHDAFGDLALRAGEELAPGGAVVIEVERLGDLGLRRPQEGMELDEVNAILVRIAVGVSADPAAAAMETCAGTRTRTREPCTGVSHACTESTGRITWVHPVVHLQMWDHA